MKEVSIILVTHNNSPHLEPCLDSIFSQDFQDYEVIIVDNGSTDTHHLRIKENYPNATLMLNRDNLGPCKARNQGIAKASGKFILCLDHDVILPSNFLSNILAVVKSDERVGAVGPKILLNDNRTIYSCGIRPSFLWRFHDIESGKSDTNGNSENKNVFGVSSAAAIYRKEALESVKQQNEYFDEDISYLFDDVDLSWRMQKKGWRILYVSGTSCLHSGGGSRNNDKISQYLCMRNRYLIIIKNESLLGLLRLPFVFIIYDLWRNVYMLAINRKLFFKASYELLKSTPKVIAKRFKLPGGKYEN